MGLRTKYSFGVICLLLLVTWLGVRHLNCDGVWFDEWWSLYVAGADVFDLSRSPGEIWQRITTDDIRQGVLYPMLLAGWGSLVGWSVFATRTLSLFAGLLTLAALYRVGYAFGRHPLVGLAAAAVLGTSIWFVYFLHEMRVYMLMVMLITLMLLIYQRLMDWKREPHLMEYSGLAIVTGLLMNTHYFAGIVVAVAGLWHLLRLFAARPRRRWWRVLIAWAFSGIMLLPLLANLPVAMETARNEPRVQPDVSLLIEIARNTFVAFSNTSVALLALLLVFAVRVRGARHLWAILVAVLGLNLIAYYLFSLNELRYNMAVLPLLALLAGFGVYELAKRRVPALVILSLWTAGVLVMDGDFTMERILQRWPGQPIREMAEILQPYVVSDDVIVNLLGNENRPTLALHPLVHYLGDTGAGIEVVENITYPGTRNFADRVREVVADTDRVWLLYDPRWTSTEWGLFEYVLNQQNFYHCATLADNETTRIWGFGRVDPDSQVWQFEDGVEVKLLGEPYLQGGLLQVWLAYHVEDWVPSSLYSVALHVADTQGQIVLQADFSLPVARTSCHFVEFRMGDLPDGAYRLHTAIYNWQTGERLVTVNEQADYPVIGRVHLTLPE